VRPKQGLQACFQNGESGGVGKERGMGKGACGRVAACKMGAAEVVSCTHAARFVGDPQVGARPALARVGSGGMALLL